jgi:hypothetical protein
MSLFIILITSACSKDVNFNPWSTAAQEIVKQALKDDKRK